MKRSKSKLALLISFALLIGSVSTACSSANSAVSSNSEVSSSSSNISQTDSSSSTSSPNKKITIANVPKMVGIDWWDRMKAGNEQWQKETGNTVFQVGSTTLDAAEQVKTLEDVIAQKVDAITVIPVSPEAVEQVLKKARDQGIVVVSHEASNQQNVDYDLEAFKNADYGAHLMDTLAKSVGEEGDYCIMVGALTMKTHQEWAAGAIARQKDKYPKMKLATEIVEASSQDASYAKAKELMSAYPSLKGMIGMDTLNTPGISLAVEEAGVADKVSVVGTCLPSTIRPYLEKGSCKAASFWDPALAGKAMCTVASKIINKEEIKDGMDLGVDGYNKVSLEGKLIFGAAWIDVDKENVSGFDF